MQTDFITPLAGVKPVIPSDKWLRWPNGWAISRRLFYLQIWASFRSMESNFIAIYQN